LSKNVCKFLTTKNPKLKFEMHLILNCDLCNNNFIEEDSKINIYDISQSMPKFSFEDSEKDKKYWPIYLQKRTSAINNFLNTLMV
jgi:hypothetical protein